MQRKNSDPNFLPSDRKNVFKEISEENRVSFHSEIPIRSDDSFNYKAQ